MTSVPQRLDSSIEALMGAVVDDFVTRLDGGERPLVEDYVLRYPQIADVLRQMLPTLELMHNSAGGSMLVPGGDASVELPGCLGDFRLVRPIGRGGMGVVYEATQVSLGRRVALKVLPFAAALDSTQLQRFKNEAHAAARLEHQNIVPVYAVGCERGVHYYAMQFIDGQSLASLIQQQRSLAQAAPVAECPSQVRSVFAAIPSELSPSNSDCTGPPRGDAGTSVGGLSGNGLRNEGVAFTDTHRFPVQSTQHSTKTAFFRTIARLALQAAEALEYAHCMGVVHRDVKPANLLVDVRGNLWVTDFGLAQVNSDSRLTLTGDLVGTLRYMSPEQAFAQSGGVDHRTDVYSLGATLYELATLEPPFTGSDRRELLRQIAFEEPIRPRRINSAIPVDLETIALKAMAKSSAERYLTAQALAEDLRHFLDEKPIRARRPSWVDRTGKWVRRHRAVVWAGGVGLIATLCVLAVSIGLIAWDRAAQRIKLASDLHSVVKEAMAARSEGRWAHAQAAAERARILLEDGAQSPELVAELQAVWADLAEHEADERLIVRIDEARLMQSDVHSQENRFNLERALPEYRETFSEYGLTPGAIPPKDAATRVQGRPPTVRLTIIAALDHWLALVHRTNPDEADWLSCTLAIADSDPWRMRLRVARSKGDRGALEELARQVDVMTQPPQQLFLLERALLECGANAEGVALLKRAQEVFPGDFWTNQNLGTAMLDTKPPQLAEACRYLTAAVALRPESPGANFNLGIALGRSGQIAQAIVAFRRAAELRPDYADAYHHLGLTLRKAGCLEDAIVALERAVSLKPERPEAAAELAGALVAAGRLQEAIVVCHRATRLAPASFQAYYYLGNALLSSGQFEAAIEIFRKAIELRGDVAEVHCNLGVTLDRTGQIDDAIAAFRKAVELEPDLVQAHFNLGLLLARIGQISEAIAAYDRVIALSPDHASVYYDLGIALRAAGQLDEAISAFGRAIELKPTNAEAYCNLGAALRARGRFSQAILAFRRGHELGVVRPDWYYPSHRWLQEHERLPHLADRLSAVLGGELQPVDAVECIAYALLCYDQNRYVAAARLMAGALDADPGLIDNLRDGYRYDAACAAVLAATAQGQDADEIDDKKRTEWRNKALQWLLADLEAFGRVVDGGLRPDRDLASHRLRRWQASQDLVGVRDPIRLAELPKSEQQAWRELWANVQALILTADKNETDVP